VENGGEIPLIQRLVGAGIRDSYKVSMFISFLKPYQHREFEIILPVTMHRTLKLCGRV